MFTSSKTFKSALIVLSLAGLMAAMAGEASARGGGRGGGGGGFRGGGSRGGGHFGGGHFGGFRSGGFRGGHFGGFRGGGFRGNRFAGFRGRIGGHFGHHHFGWNRFGWNRGWNRGWGWNRYSWNYGYRRPWYPSYSYPAYQPSYPTYAPAYVLPAAVYTPAPAYTPPPPPPAAIPNPTYLTIQFQQGVSAADVTSFLTSYNVKLADGPTQDGTYRVLVHQGPVPQDQLNQLVESMRGQTNIVAQVAA